MRDARSIAHRWLGYRRELGALVDHIATKDGHGDLDVEDIVVATGQVVTIKYRHVGQHARHQYALDVLFTRQPGGAGGVGTQRFHAANRFFGGDNRALVGFAGDEAIQADKRIVMEGAGDVARGNHRDAPLEVGVGWLVFVCQLFAYIAEQIVTFEVDEGGLNHGADFVFGHGIE